MKKSLKGNEESLNGDGDTSIGHGNALKGEEK